MGLFQYAPLTTVLGSFPYPISQPFFDWRAYTPMLHNYGGTERTCCSLAAQAASAAGRGRILGLRSWALLHGT